MHTLSPLTKAEHDEIVSKHLKLQRWYKALTAIQVACVLLYAYFHWKT